MSFGIAQAAAARVPGSMATATTACNVCAFCASEGKKSRLHIGGGTRTLMGGGNPFYDEDGRMHVHEPNYSTYEFRCSNGHTGHVRYPSPPCPVTTCSEHRSGASYHWTLSPQKTRSAETFVMDCGSLSPTAGVHLYVAQKPE